MAVEETLRFSQEFDFGLAIRMPPSAIHTQKDRGWTVWRLLQETRWLSMIQRVFYPHDALSQTEDPILGRQIHSIPTPDFDAMPLDFYVLLRLLLCLGCCRLKCNDANNCAETVCVFTARALLVRPYVVLLLSPESASPGTEAMEEITIADFDAGSVRQH